MKAISVYTVIEIILTVSLIWIGSTFGTDNIWLLTACIVGTHFVIECLCSVRGWTVKRQTTNELQSAAVASAKESEPVEDTSRNAMNRRRRNATIDIE